MKFGYLTGVLVTGCMLAFSLSGCAGAKRAFGMQKVAPDEFTVVTKPPLVLPPDYSLRPPQPGAPSPAYIEPSGRAQYALFGREGMSDTAQGYTTGEIGLLDTTGGSAADPAIRQTINAETASLIEKDSTIADEILFWQKAEAPDEPVIDAEEEAKRLKEKGVTPQGGAEDAPPAKEAEDKGLF